MSESIEVVLDRIVRQLEVLDSRMTGGEAATRELHRQINSTSPKDPGLSIRVDRTERAIAAVRWIGTGGLTGVVGTLYLLWRILNALGSSPT